MWMRAGVAGVFAALLAAMGSVGGMLLMDRGVDRCLPAMQDAHTEAAAAGTWLAWTAYLAVVAVGWATVVGLTTRPRSWVIVSVIALAAMVVALIGMHEFGSSMCDSNFSRSQRG
ncbi:hypothetical protein SCNU_14054 [Gordonia neofelifaecis NRRL B-59395]|uniref:Uncharacterized protein n=2 Tax=Gordonia TaxID=2053 RepID=F1YLL9_9ACTN|nr:hypothetical protein SCNU_14054 [Gordonia neofelifaecis NRRL B-59395]